MVERSLEQLELRQRLERAIGNGELALWHQPLVEVPTGRVSGVERRCAGTIGSSASVLGWRSPRGGALAHGR